MWAVREAGLGATARTPGGGPDTWTGWEDSAVPPERLGDYLRDFQSLLHKYGYDAASLYPTQPAHRTAVSCRSTQREQAMDSTSTTMPHPRTGSPDP